MKKPKPWYSDAQLHAAISALNSVMPTKQTTPIMARAALDAVDPFYPPPIGRQPNVRAIVMHARPEDCDEIIAAFKALYPNAQMRKLK